MDENTSILIVMLPLFAALILLWIFTVIRDARRKKRLRDEGCEEVHKPFYKKGDAIYFITNNNFKKAKPIEIIGVSEIKRNARLAALEIRYRMDGNVQLRRISGTTVNRLLTVEDKLGYGG